MNILVEQVQTLSIMTVTGEKQVDDFRSFEYILPHEHLIQNLTKYFNGQTKTIEQIELSNYSKIKENPHSNMSNLALNDVEEICTELRQAFGEDRVESTNQDNGRDITKLHQIATRIRINIICGAKPIIKGSLYADEEKNKVFVNVEKFSKEISEELFAEDRESKCGLIGEFYLEDSLFDKHQNVIFESCIREAAKYSAPLYIECRRTNDLKLLEKTLEFIKKISEGAKVKLVLWNLDLVFKKEVANSQDGKNTFVKTTFENLDSIKELISRGNIIGFDVYSYIDELYELATIIKVLIDNGLHESILISSGVKFKTHLKRYGGVGYGIIAKFITLLRGLGVNDNQIEQLLRTNVLSLMNWWKPLKVKEVYIKMWKCDTCGKEQEESVGKFSKLGHDFCCAKCMRNFKW